MLSDVGFHIAGHTVTAIQLLGVGALLLALAALLLTFSRERRVALKRSAVTDALTIEMRRIAEALERIAAQGSYQVNRRAGEEAVSRSTAKTKDAAVVQGKPETQQVAYSMFGR